MQSRSCTPGRKWCPCGAIAKETGPKPTYALERTPLIRDPENASFYIGLGGMALQRPITWSPKTIADCVEKGELSEIWCPSWWNLEEIAASGQLPPTPGY